MRPREVHIVRLALPRDRLEVTIGERALRSQQPVRLNLRTARVGHVSRAAAGAIDEPSTAAFAGRLGGDESVHAPVVDLLHFAFLAVIRIKGAILGVGE